jgi:PPOX class probable F420-dependent enzyme
MSERIPDSHRDLLADETRAMAFLATVMADSTPQVTPVWFDMEDEHIRINTARGRVKDRNMSARPNVAIAIVDPGNPYRYLHIRGTVVSKSEEGARDHIDRLAAKYTDQETFPVPEDQVRVIYRIQPASVSSME